MKHFLILAALLIVAFPAQSQTDALLPAFYEAESADLLTLYQGVGWVQLVDGAYNAMESTEIDDSVSFVVSTVGQIVIYRDLLTVDGAAVEVCIDALCTSISTVSSTAQRAIPVAFNVDSESEVSITNLDGGILRIDSFLILGGDQLEAVLAPDPSRHYVTLADGTIAAIDQTISGGEVVQIAFSAAIALLLLVLVVVSAWKK